MVFLGSSCRETAKNAIKKNRWEKTKGKKVFFSQLFRPKVFDIDFRQKVFYGVFELPLLRNAQKRHKKNKIKNNKKQKGTYLPDLLAICQIHPRFIFFFLSAPCVQPRIRSEMSYPHLLAQGALRITSTYSPCLFLARLGWSIRIITARTDTDLHGRACSRRSSTSGAGLLPCGDHLVRFATPCALRRVCSTSFGV